jgi:GH24 family phage-related lysozyme (muramidase)
MTWASMKAMSNDAVTVNMSQTEFDALVSFHYNTGGDFRATLTKPR